MSPNFIRENWKSMLDKEILQILETYELKKILILCEADEKISREIKNLFPPPFYVPVIYRLAPSAFFIGKFNPPLLVVDERVIEFTVSYALPVLRFFQKNGGGSFFEVVNEFIDRFKPREVKRSLEILTFKKGINYKRKRITPQAIFQSLLLSLSKDIDLTTFQESKHPLVEACSFREKNLVDFSRKNFQIEEILRYALKYMCKVERKSEDRVDIYLPSLDDPLSLNSLKINYTPKSIVLFSDEKLDPQTSVQLVKSMYNNFREFMKAAYELTENKDLLKYFSPTFPLEKIKRVFSKSS